MAKKDKLSLNQLRQKIGTVAPSSAAPSAIRKKTPTTNLAEDHTLLAAAMRDVAPLPASRNVELDVRKPPPIRRQPNATADPTADTLHDSAAANPLALPAHWLSGETPLVRGSDEHVIKQALSGITPITAKRVELESAKPPPLPKQHVADEQAALAESIYAPTPLELRLEGGDELQYLKVGLPRTMLRDLRRGRWVIEAQLDLHGATRDQARDILAQAMGEWRRVGTRVVRVIHGKGLGSPGKDPVLKKLVAGWLINYDDVMAYCQAKVHDGGAGALIVLLKAGKRS